MSNVVTTILSIISYLVKNKDQIQQTVQDLETLLPDSGNGAAKLAVVKNLIATAIGAEAQIEAVWPFVAPIFNAIVAKIKGKPAPVIVPAVAQVAHP
jgi:hypothetical protein